MYIFLSYLYFVLCHKLFHLSILVGTMLVLEFMFCGTKIYTLILITSYQIVNHPNLLYRSSCLQEQLTHKRYNTYASVV